jgi:hypothetical protein
MRIAVLSALALATMAMPSLAVTPAVTYTSVGTLTDGRAFTLGFSFSLSGPATVDALGVWAEGDSGDYLAGLWEADGTLLASTTVLATDLLQDNFRWGKIAPLALAAGNYVVAAEYRGGAFPAAPILGLSTRPGYSWTDDLQVIGAGLNFPTLSVDDPNSYGTNGILWANFSYEGGVIPEPATWALLILGFGAVGAAMRRSRRNAQVVPA